MKNSIKPKFKKAILMVLTTAAMFTSLATIFSNEVNAQEQVPGDLQNVIGERAKCTRGSAGGDAGGGHGTVYFEFHTGGTSWGTFCTTFMERAVCRPDCPTR